MASAAGAARNPAWYYNLAAHPDQAWIETPGHKVAVTAEQLHGAERDQAWQQITAAVPRFAGYQQATDRELPIIRLVPAPAEISPRGTEERVHGGQESMAPDGTSESTGWRHCCWRHDYPLMAQVPRP